MYTLPQHIGGQLFGAGLADAAGDADYTQRRVGAVDALKGADLLDRLDAVVHDEGKRRARLVGRGQRGIKRPAPARAIDHCRAGACTAARPRSSAMSAWAPFASAAPM
jgi:hypothetical protein